MSTTIEISPCRVPLEVSGAAGLVTLTQGGASLTFIDRDALAVAREILRAAGYEWVAMYHDVFGTCLDVEIDEPVDAKNEALQQIVARWRRNRPDLFQDGGAS